MSEIGIADVLRALSALPRERWDDAARLLGFSPTSDVGRAQVTHAAPPEQTSADAAPAVLTPELAATSRHATTSEAQENELPARAATRAGATRVAFPSWMAATDALPAPTPIVVQSV